ncbi:MAG: DUF5717 family protein [Eubacteriales bacterium]|nr:DUF5717 family protein [Eubacteriales bacterium]
MQVKKLKRRIDQLLNEKFEYETPPMRIDQKTLHGQVRKGESFRGSFTIENPVQKKMKGFLYASSPRVGFDPPAFSGISERILYEVDTTGMEEGEVLEGAFTICSSIGEYQLPYRIEMEKQVVRTSTEVIESMEAFTALAKRDFQKAYVLFLSADFARMLEKDSPQYLTLYEGILAQAVSYRSLEEFLAGAGQKEAVRIQADKQAASFGSVTQPIQEKIILTKNTWGFFRLDISSDAPFLWIERPIVTSDEFIGSTYTLNYLIDTSRMHAGKNYGRITIQGEAGVLTVDVTAEAAGKRERDMLLPVQHQQLVRLEQCYVAFRTRKMDMNTWLRRSTEAIDKYKKSGGKSAMLDLIQAQLYFAAGKDDEACMALEALEQHKERLNSPELLGYYLYLTTFYHKEKNYVDYVEQKVLELQQRNPENWILQWVLLYIQEKLLRHPAEKLAAIKRQYQYGCHSRIMYLEAAQVLERSPLLLKRLDPFEIQVLHFMCREEMMTGELVMQLTELAGRAKDFQDVLYKILCECYDKYPSRGLVMAICALLIKGHKTGNEYFEWFERGVEADLRLTGLYEYYIESMPADRKGVLPQIIRMYFSYNNTLSQQKKAAVYANVIRNRENDPNTYNSYRPAMEKFMLEQLEAGKISRDLAILYQTFLTRQLLTPKLAEPLVKALFTWEITCDAPGAKSVVVRHRQLGKEQKVNLSGGKACVQIYGEDHQIFICDENRCRYAVAIPYEKEKLLEDAELFTACRELSPNATGLILHDLSLLEGQETTAETIRIYQKMLEIPGIREECREKARRDILDYYAENPGEEAGEYLKTIEIDSFVKTDKKKLVELLVSQGMYQEAFRIVSVYGAEKVETSALVRLCSRMILNLEFEEDDMLLALCAGCLDQNKYDETVLAYLLSFYDGPVEKMKHLWQAGNTFGLETYRLEEKILLMVLFTRKGMEQTEAIFDSYRRAMGKNRLLRAYVILMSYEYFVRQQPVQEPVFAYLERAYEKGNSQEEVCRLALLSYYAGQGELSERQTENAQELLESYANQGMQFAFFKKFSPALQRVFLLFDKSFVEYRTNPAATVTIRYRFEHENGEPSREYRETVNALFEGIFVKEVTLFEGEKMVYSIKEELNGKVTETAEQVLEFEGTEDAFGASRYGMINSLSKKLRNAQENGAEDLVRNYLEQENLAEQIFTLM